MASNFSKLLVSYFCKHSILQQISSNLIICQIWNEVSMNTSSFNHYTNGGLLACNCGGFPMQEHPKATLPSPLSRDSPRASNVCAATPTTLATRLTPRLATDLRTNLAPTLAPTLTTRPALPQLRLLSNVLPLHFSPLLWLPFRKKIFSPQNVCEF